MDQSEEAVPERGRYRHHDLSDYAGSVLQGLDVPPRDAQVVADCLVKAELRGVSSHGLVRLPVYTRRVEAGVVKARPAIRMSVAGTSAALIDGDNGLGPVVASQAMEAALDLARAHGIGFVGVRHSNHFGAAAFYVEKAISDGCIGLAISNAPPNMAPFGGARRFLGTNPFAIGIPADREPPLIVDASASVAARGKIVMAAHKNERIPEGWAIDPDGFPTTDPEQALAGAVLPFGGPKGSAIAFVIDILSGVLTGAAFAEHLNTLDNLTAEQNVGHVLAAVRTDLFLPENEFRARMDAILHMLKASPPAPGGSTRVLVPGEIELMNEASNRERGIELSAPVVAQLTALGAALNVPFPAPLMTSLHSKSASA